MSQLKVRLTHVILSKTNGGEGKAKEILVINLVYFYLGENRHLSRMVTENCENLYKYTVLYHFCLIKVIHMQGSEHRESYGKHFSPKDRVPDVLRLMGAIKGGQDSAVGPY